MDIDFSQSASTFFEQLLQFVFTSIAVPLIFIFSLIVFILYQVFKPTREEKITRWLCEKVSLSTATQAQHGAIRAIHMSFDTLTKSYLKKRNPPFRNNISLKEIDEAIEQVNKLCEKHNLPTAFVRNFIDGCIALVNKEESNAVYIGLTSKHQR